MSRKCRQSIPRGRLPLYLRKYPKKLTKYQQNIFVTHFCESLSRKGRQSIPPSEKLPYIRNYPVPPSQNKQFILCSKNRPFKMTLSYLRSHIDSMPKFCSKNHLEITTGNI